RPPFPPIVTALSAAIATACLFNIPTTAVIYYQIDSVKQKYINSDILINIFVNYIFQDSLFFLLITNVNPTHF
ncbi:MAG: hypothetical protein ABIO44_13215, partial [Saprospiraceae bacterium]